MVCEHAIRTRDEVAEILTARCEPITKSGVFMAEKRAVRKLRAALQEIASDIWPDLQLLDSCEGTEPW